MQNKFPVYFHEINVFPKNKCSEAGEQAEIVLGKVVPILVFKRLRQIQDIFKHIFLVHFTALDKYELEMALEVATNRNEVLLKRKISPRFFDDICH